MKALFLGDVVGNSGRAAIKQELKNQIIKNNIEFVIANGENFWDHTFGELVISNPPYGDFVNGKKVKRGMGKYLILERLCELDKPFCLLMPTTFLQTKKLKSLKDKFGKFQIIMPSTKIQFYKINRETKEKFIPGKCNLYTCWYCFNMKLKSDFIVV